MVSRADEISTTETVRPFAIVNDRLWDAAGEADLEGGDWAPNRKPLTRLPSVLSVDGRALPFASFPGDGCKLSLRGGGVIGFGKFVGLVGGVGGGGGSIVTVCASMNSGFGCTGVGAGTSEGAEASTAGAGVSSGVTSGASSEALSSTC